MFTFLGTIFSVPVVAGVIQSDVFTVYGPQGDVRYQWGVTEDGVLLGTQAFCETAFFHACRPGESGSSTDYNVYQLDVADVADRSKFSDYTLVYEDSITSLVTDIFGVCQNADESKGFLCFASASEGESLTEDPGSGNRTAVESGVPFDATFYLMPNLISNGWTATFSSIDVHVPEPSTLALLGLCLAGLVFDRRKN